VTTEFSVAVPASRIPLRPLGDAFRPKAATVDSFVNVEDSHPTPLDVRLVVDLRFLAGDYSLVRHCQTDTWLGNAGKPASVRLSSRENASLSSVRRACPTATR